MCYDKLLSIHRETPLPLRERAWVRGRRIAEFPDENYLINSEREDGILREGEAISGWLLALSVESEWAGDRKSRPYVF